MGHDAIKRQNGITSDDVETRGWMRLSYDCRELQIAYEEDVTKKLKKKIHKIFTDLQAQLKTL